jgi:hypothetical protein
MRTIIYVDGFNLAVLVTNDTDLVEPIRIVRQELTLQVGVLNPHAKCNPLVLSS